MCFQFLTAFCSADTYSSIAIDIHLTCVAAEFQISPFIVKFLYLGDAEKFFRFLSPLFASFLLRFLYGRSCCSLSMAWERVRFQALLDFTKLYSSFSFFLLDLLLVVVVVVAGGFWGF